jgi:endogenous inhibitor of DNA gyrase (YacG/DUF329 family)
MTNKPKIVCPQCGKKDTWRSDNKYRPFCSERCKLIDLGDWADEKHRVPAEPVDFPDENDKNEQ